MKTLTVIGALCILVGGVALAQTFWQMHRMRSEGLGAIAGGGSFFILLPLGLALLVIALILRLRAR